MEITTLAALLACPADSVVLDGQGNAWQSSRYEAGLWYAAGSEVEKTAADMLKIGPLRLIHAPGPVPTAVTETAAAIVALQTEIQISTCYSCHGRRTQAMVLEPYNTMPCLRCHGEGTTHDVPPGRYGAVLAALLDALGGSSVEQIAGRLAPLTAAFQAEES